MSIQKTEEIDEDQSSTLPAPYKVSCFVERQHSAFITQKRFRHKSAELFKNWTFKF